MTSSARPVLSTMWAPDDPAWSSTVDVLPLRPLNVADVRQFWRECDAHEAVVLLGSVPARSRYRDLVLAMSLKFRPRRRRPRVLITDSTWEPRSRALEQRLPSVGRLVPWAAPRLIKLLDGPHVRYGVLSSDELEVFAKQWGVPRDRVVCTSFPHTLPSPEQLDPPTDGGYLFAGGNSLRDYRVLLQALDQIGGRPTRVAAAWQPDSGRPWLTTGPVSHEAFIEMLLGCRATVTPLAPAVRSAGQQTYLNAMRLGKPVIVTEAPGVRDLVQHGETGLIVPPTPGALGEAIDFVMDPENDDECRQMGERARQWVMGHAEPRHYWTRLLELSLGE